MSGTRKAHHSGTYHVRARRIRQAAWADPHTRCWKCHRTIDAIRHKNGTPAKWTAGHVIDGQINGALQPECSVCAARTGAERGNRLRNPRSEDPYR